MGRHTQYTVSLNEEERIKLDEMSKNNKLSARILKRILILLALDGKNKSNLNHRQIAAALHTTVTTIVATAKDYCEQGLDYSLSHHFNPTSLRARKVNGELEANVIQLACSKAPEGQATWTLDLLTREVNKKGVAEPVSKETIRLMLKKTNLSLT
jgi:transposase